MSERAALGHRLPERHQRECAALALVVGLSSTNTYLSVTISSSVHTISDRMPSTASVPATRHAR